MVMKSLVIRIDRNDPKKPLKKQIVDEIRALIDQGVIPPGAPLSSTREFAEKLGISRYTVCQAYEELQVLGYLSSRQGSYNIVQERRREACYSPNRRSAVAWEEAANSRAEDLYRGYVSNLADIPTRLADSSGTAINLSEMQLDSELFPVRDFNHCVRQVLSTDGRAAMDFAPTEGLLGLREYIAERLRLHGISTSKDEILITYGSQQALDLIIRLLGGPRKKVVIEAPTYFNILPLLRFSGTEAISVPMRGDGMDLDALRRVLDDDKVAFVYTIPNFHNPTGITTSHHHRERLLDICLQHKVPILEDGFEEEMRYFGNLPLPIKSIDERNIVIYVGTFTKILFPGLRLGWVTADRACIQRLTAVKRSSDLRCGRFVQSVLFHFCREGYYDLHLKRLHKVFRRRLDTALKAMAEHFPDSVTWTKPRGGYTIWVKMPVKLSPEKLCERMRAEGVIVSPGVYYFVDLKESEYFRISIARIDEHQILQGLKRLGKALGMLSDALPGRGRSPAGGSGAKTRATEASSPT